MAKGMKCKLCGSGYHCCTSCDHTGVPWEIEGWCSGDCYWVWSQDEITTLRAELNDAKKHLTSARAFAISSLHRAEKERMDAAMREEESEVSEVSDET